MEIATGKGPGVGWVCPSTAWNVWVLDFVKEIFHSVSPGAFESMFIKAGGSETKDGLR